MTDVQSELITLLGIVGAVLIAATAIAHALRVQWSSQRNHAVIENLYIRIQAWWVIAGALGLAFLAGEGGVILFFALCSFAALREIITVTDTRRGDHWAVAAAFFLVVPAQYYLIWAGRYPLYATLIPVGAIVLLPTIALFRGEKRDFLIRVSEIQWAVMVAVYCVSFVPALLSLQIPGFEGRNRLLIAFLIVVVQLSDVAQYIWGKLIGKTRIAPSLSPGKTVEGFLGGVFSTGLVGAGLWWMTPFSAIQAGLIALILALLGFCGGLVMSAIKRDRGLKDWGRTVPGHGGFIDRLDSLIFSAPIFFHLMRVGWGMP